MILFVFINFEDTELDLKLLILLSRWQPSNIKLLESRNTLKRMDKNKIKKGHRSHISNKSAATCDEEQVTLDRRIHAIVMLIGYFIFLSILF